LYIIAAMQEDIQESRYSPAMMIIAALKGKVVKGHLDYTSGLE
jgi:hypothetical protein